MPILTYKCERSSCRHEQDRIFLGPIDKAPATYVCEQCKCGDSKRILTVPARVIMGDGTAARRRDRIKEPIWRYPDGHIESMNSANTRPEE